ncbi:MAG: UbiA family prenyltransferase [Euryarchaeota archaeon]|jgi:4-hydroxybenzoate polyprenyltransferase|nr:UbiA family prenyltransferase [Euryarchaeota archaeon]
MQSFGEKNYSNTIEKGQRESYDGFLNISKNILSFLIYNSLFISLVCVFLTYVSFEVLNVQPNTILLFAVFLSTFSVYSLNRLTDLEEDSVNVPGRESYVKGKEKSLLALCIISYGVALLLGFLVNPVTVLVLLFPLGIGILYSLEVSPKLPRLKNIPGMKNFSVTLSWAAGAAFIPVVFSYPGLWITFLLFYFVFVKFLVNTISFDVRDIEGDKKSGVRTIPVLLGRSRTKLLLFGIQSTLIFWMLIVISEGIFTRYWLLFTLSIVYGFWYIHYFSENRKRGTFSRDLLIDGEWMILAFLCFIISTFS